MAIFSVQVFKAAGAVKWSNRYHVNGASLEAAAVDALDVLVPAERSLTPTFVSYTELLVSTITPGDRQFVSTVLVGTGGRAFSTDALPLFNTLMARFSVGGVGDLARKYYRGLTEGDIAGGAVVPSLVDSVTDILAAMIADMATAGSPLCKTNGDLLTEVTVQSEVQERQLHRRRRRSV